MKFSAAGKTNISQTGKYEKKGSKEGIKTQNTESAANPLVPTEKELAALKQSDIPKPKKELINIPITAADKAILQANIKQINDIKVNSPNYRTNNPITSEGEPETVFKSSVKKTAFSDVDNIRSPPSAPAKENRKACHPEVSHPSKTSDSKDWKPSIKKLGAKESDHYEVFSKRGKKFTTQSSSTTSSENPLLGQAEKITKPRQSGNGDQVISAEYQRIANRRDQIQSAGGSRTQWSKYTSSSIFSNQQPEKDSSSQSTSQQSSAQQARIMTANEGVANKHRGSEAKNLIGYEYALPFNKVKEPTDKINHSDMNSKYVTFNQVNDCDFRKKSNRIGQDSVSQPVQKSQGNSRPTGFNQMMISNIF